MISDKLEIAKAFNKVFVNVGKCVNNLKKQGFNSMNTLSQAKATFKFSEINSEFVKQELEKMDVNKATGLDDLHPRLLKVAAPFIAEPLSVIINKSLMSGCFPSDFKRAKIIPVPKGIVIQVT